VFLLAITALLSLPGVAGASSGNTWYVATSGSDLNNGTSPATAFLDIATAVAAASSGDTVIVENGTYTTENVGNSSLSLTIESANGPTNCTLSGDGESNVFYLSGTGITINGFSITDSYSEFSGAIETYQATATFENCIFYNNVGNIGAGAFTGYSSVLTFINCVFANNVATGNGAVGGALYIDGTSTAYVYNSSFTGNSAPQGGAIYVADGGQLTLYDSILWGDSITGTAENGGAELDWSGGASITQAYNDIQDSGYAGSNGDISANPDFTNTESGTPTVMPNLSIPSTSAAATVGLTADQAAGDTTDILGVTWYNPPSMGAYQAPRIVTHFMVCPPRCVTAGKPFYFKVTALDAQNDIVTTYAGTVYFTTTDTGLGVQLPAPSTLTDGTGTFCATLSTAGCQTITATQETLVLAGPGRGHKITGTSWPITVLAGCVTHFSVAAPSTVTAASPFKVTVTALDAWGNKVKWFCGTVELESNDPNAEKLGYVRFTSRDCGEATACVCLDTATSYGWKITAYGSSKIIFGTSGLVQVTVGPVTKYRVTASSPQVSGVAFTVTVTAQDKGGNRVPGYLGTALLTSTDPGAPALGSITFTAADAGTGTASVTLVTPTDSVGKAHTKPSIVDVGWTITATDSVTSSITGTSSVIVVNPVTP
jgi:predicted outer membrane repeat protein